MRAAAKRLGVRMAVGAFAPLLLFGCVAGQDAPASHPVVTGTIETAAGDLRFELFDEAAPIGVANFVRYVRAGHYDGSSFYRATRDQPTSHGACCISVVQGGMLASAMAGSAAGAASAMAATPYPPIALEPTSATGMRNLRGRMAYARLARDSASSEFFVSLADNPILDEGGAGHPDGLGYAVFGRISDGMEVLDALSAAPRKPGEGALAGQLLAQPLRIIAIRLDGTGGAIDGSPPATDTDYSEGVRP